MRPTLKLPFYLALLALLVVINSVDGLDFGFGKIRDTFSSFAAKIPINEARQDGIEETPTVSTNSSTRSWKLPEAIKNPIKAVASFPSSVGHTAWKTVSERVANHDPENNVKFYYYDDPR